MMVVAAATISSTSCIQIMMIQGSGGGYPSKSMELRWISSRSRRKNLNPNPNSRVLGSLKSKPPPLMMPIYISTDPSHINLQQLSELYSSCNHSGHRFPEVDPNTGIVEEAMDLDKLRIALSHSCVVVSVFCKPQHVDVTKTAKQIQNQENQKQMSKGFVGDLMESVMPVTPSNAKLVGFGRAVSDLGLTASIYDVMVLVLVSPSLQGMGIGTIIVKRIVRMLTSSDIYDIAALCSRKESTVQLLFLALRPRFYSRTPTQAGEKLIYCSTCCKVLLTKAIRLISGSSSKRVDSEMTFWALLQ
ncbi:uncharacterized protein LOC110426132 isoform X2 [Herrania umbratica]|uniref:Uncharacterized protein LOC110426132 isoform X2 n=1 Tax=Herrania umbratica TaxID=108875 RepID=A0A6J1BCQ5_9ROSI|nr:uncharacterized protein LOC110426132 isoform X2 [Herrania umbratica]